VQPRFPRRALLAAALAAPLLGGCDGPSGGRSALPRSPDPRAGATVTAANGPVAVPGAPLRVVVLDTAELDSAMTLGIPPVGACRVADEPGLGSYWDARELVGTAVAGTVGDPDLARIRALRPQLILGNQTRDGARYNALRTIAPTVLTAGTGAPWRENFLLHARALGRQSAADAVIAAHRAQLDQTGRAISAAGAGGRKVSLVRFTDEGRVRVYGRQNFLGTLLAGLPVGRPDPQNADRFDLETTPDQLSAADGELLLYGVHGTASGADAVLGSPGWQALGAVRAHRALRVDDRLWFEGIGYTGANLVLGQLQTLLGA
jgi:iron complex transport system substrate-binding protein